MIDGNGYVTLVIITIGLVSVHAATMGFSPEDFKQVSSKSTNGTLNKERTEISGRNSEIPDRSIVNSLTDFLIAIPTVVKNLTIVNNTIDGSTSKLDNLTHSSTVNITTSTYLENSMDGVNIQNTTEDSISLQGYSTNIAIIKSITNLPSAAQYFINPATINSAINDPSTTLGDTRQGISVESTYDNIDSTLNNPVYLMQSFIQNANHNQSILDFASNFLGFTSVPLTEVGVINSPEQVTETAMQFNSISGNLTTVPSNTAFKPDWQTLTRNNAIRLIRNVAEDNALNISARTAKIMSENSPSMQENVDRSSGNDFKLFSNSKPDVHYFTEDLVMNLTQIKTEDTSRNNPTHSSNITTETDLDNEASKLQIKSSSGLTLPSTSMLQDVVRVATAFQASQQVTASNWLTSVMNSTPQNVVRKAEESQTSPVTARSGVDLNSELQNRDSGYADLQLSVQANTASTGFTSLLNSNFQIILIEDTEHQISKSVRAINGSTLSLWNTSMNPINDNQLKDMLQKPVTSTKKDELIKHVNNSRSDVNWKRSLSVINKSFGAKSGSQETAQVSTSNWLDLLLNTSKSNYTTSKPLMMKLVRQDPLLYSENNTMLMPKSNSDDRADVGRAAPDPDDDDDDDDDDDRPLYWLTVTIPTLIVLLLLVVFLCFCLRTGNFCFGFCNKPKPCGCDVPEDPPCSRTRI